MSHDKGLTAQAVALETISTMLKETRDGFADALTREGLLRERIKHLEQRLQKANAKLAAAGQPPVEFARDAQESA